MLRTAIVLAMTGISALNGTTIILAIPITTEAEFLLNSKRSLHEMITVVG